MTIADIYRHFFTHRARAARRARAALSFARSGYPALARIMIERALSDLREVSAARARIARAALGGFN